MITGKLVRGVFTRIGAYGASGAKAMVRMTPKNVMNASSLTMGRIAGNMRRNIPSSWTGPGISALRHVQEVGTFAHRTVSRYAPGVPWVTYVKNHGMQADHVATAGLSLALFKGRHTNLI